MKFVGRLFLLLVGLTGCYSDSAAPTATTVHGRYLLRTIDERPIPAVFTEQANLKLEFMRGVITLQADLTFTDSTEIRRTENQLVRRVIDVAEGTYTHNQDVINLRSTRGENYNVSFFGQSLTQNLAGIILVYRR
ncbi:MAG: hypothetical protein ACRENP_04735 [Longimicrobiales bacterium]